MTAYSPLQETQRIFQYLCENGDQLGLPASIQDIKDRVTFVSNYNRVYFPIPFKEMEVASALKAVEGSVACALADLKFGKREREVCVNLEKATNFLFQAYRATVDGLGKLDPKVKSKLKGTTCEVRSRFVLLAEHLSCLDTDFLHAQSDPYRRMSANLYETKIPGEYYHIHGSLEASRTLNMIGLESYRPDLNKHPEIVSVIEPAVRKFTVGELETMNAHNRQAGIPAYRHEDFLQTSHVCL